MTASKSITEGSKFSSHCGTPLDVCVCVCEQGACGGLPGGAWGVGRVWGLGVGCMCVCVVCGCVACAWGASVYGVYLRIFLCLGAHINVCTYMYKQEIGIQCLLHYLLFIMSQGLSPDARTH